MKASNRPFAMYASANAADPIDREMRIAFLTLRARVTTDRPDRAIEITKSDSLSLSDAVTAWLGRPRGDVSSAGPSAVAAKVSDRVGSCTTPTLGRPSTTSPIDTQKNGIPFA
jgi:hypothetical protein